MMDRRQQIIESFAGPFAQLVLAGIASIIAASFPGWILSETMYKFAVLNYLVVIMNLIPLLELDGYYILADLIEIPDLRERSLVFMRRDLFHKLRIRERFPSVTRGSPSTAFWASRSRSSRCTRPTTTGRRCSAIS
jgi:putative peptide zinc metalloprotease protein